MVDKPDRHSAHAKKSKRQLIQELTALEDKLDAIGSDRPNDQQSRVLDLLGQNSVFRTLIDTIPAPVFVKNRSGVYLECNSMFEEYLGRTRNQIIGITAYELASKDLADIYTKADNDLFSRGGSQVYEAQVIFADGSRHDVMFHKAVIETEHSPECLIGVMLDITARKQAESASHKLVDAFDALGEVVAVISADEKYVFFNKRYKELNSAVADTIAPGKLFEDHLKAIAERGLVSEAKGRVNEWVQERLERHRNPTEPEELERQDGIWMLVRTQRLADGSSIILGTNITALKKVDAALNNALRKAEEANKSKTKFLATMSHEFRTPLNAILGFSEMMKSQYLGQLGAEGYLEYAGDIHNSGQHMLDLVNDVLDVAAIEAGKRPVSREPVEIQNLLENSIRNFAKAAQDDGIRLALNISDALPVLNADSRALTQIMHNLLSNAIKFTERNGSIDVSSWTHGPDLIIKISDTGYGIPEELLPTITEPFVQASSNPHKAQKGTGLGLSIVKSLVEIHDGELSIESELGKGTAVCVQFPFVTS